MNNGVSVIVILQLVIQLALTATNCPVGTLRVVIGLPFATAHAQIRPVIWLLVINEQARFHFHIDRQFNVKTITKVVYLDK